MNKKQEQSNVTRISASDAKPTKKTSAKVKAPASSARLGALKRPRSFGPLGKIGGYFKGAWTELRQVHWPTRRATWGLTGAVLLFSTFFVVFITLLDAGFKYVFEQILR